MFRKNLFNIIGEIKTPERKLNVLMPVMVVFCLAGVVYFLYNQLSNDNKSNLSDCRTENIELKKENKDKDKKIMEITHKYDSLEFKNYNDRNETVKELEILINKQNEQKKKMRK